ncbi:MAG: ABC transporter permease [Bryobacteraceae bacterium]|nr:ABC transporter permease [Bryobacteraceae bacterium]
MLSVLGIVVGVATVTVMAAVGKGAEQKVLDGIRRMGTNLITVTAGKVAVMAGRERQTALVTTLLPADADAIQSSAGDLVSLVAPVQSRKMPVKFAEISLNTNIVGTSPEFLKIRHLRLQSGDLFDEQDNRASRRVAVVGQTLVHDLFGGADPVGQRIRVGRVPFEVIGALAPAGVDANGVDQDDQILVPLRTALRRVFNVIYLNNIYVQARSEDLMDECAARVGQILRERHHLREGIADDFTIQTQAVLLRAQRETQRTFSSLTISVASLSLVVGGVGILAVMLMSVRERVREIGLRRALGARRRDILFQFLLEAIILSVSGGLAGAAVGIAGVSVLAYLASWDAVVAPEAVSLAVASSAAIGLVFGTIPARKASLANPVSSLRAE